MTDDAIKAAGRDAWTRIKQRDRKAWDDWVCVGHAIKIGRDEALKAAGAKRPFGKRYSSAMAAWLALNGLDDIGQQVRYRIVGCIDNLPAIEQWRAGLDEKERDKLNHPDSVFWHWQRSLTAGKTRAPQHRTERPKGVSGSSYAPRPPAAPQDIIRAVAAAIREHWTNDTFQLAVAAIEAYERCKAEPAALPAKAAAPISAKKIAPQHALEAA